MTYLWGSCQTVFEFFSLETEYQIMLLVKKLYMVRVVLLVIPFLATALMAMNWQSYIKADVREDQYLSRRESESEHRRLDERINSMSAKVNEHEVILRRFERLETKSDLIFYTSGTLVVLMSGHLVAYLFNLRLRNELAKLAK
jgi:hypothetical protein